MSSFYQLWEKIRRALNVKLKHKMSSPFFKVQIGLNNLAHHLYLYRPAAKIYPEILAALAISVGVGGNLSLLYMSVDIPRVWEQSLLVKGLTQIDPRINKTTSTSCSTVERASDLSSYESNSTKVRGLLGENKKRPCRD